MIFHSAFEAAGYQLLDPTDPRCLGEFPTWDKDGVRVALYLESLVLQRGAVLRQAAAGNEVTLHGILVDLDKRLKGRADAAMRVLLDTADSHDITIYIEPVPMVKGGMNRSQLVAFYAKRGFVGTDSSNKVMCRRPGGAPAAQVAKPAVVARPPRWFSIKDLGVGPLAIDRPGVFPGMAGV